MFNIGLVRVSTRKTKLEHPGEIETYAINLNEKNKIKLPKSAENSAAIYVALFLYSSLIPQEMRKSGLKISIRSSIPIGSGLGSSAAYSSAISSAFLYFGGHISKKMSQAEKLEIINNWAYKSEQVIHGAPSGVDNYTVVHGGFVRYMKNKSIENIPLKGLDMEFVIVDTNVPKNTKAMVMGVKERHDKDEPGVRNKIDQIHDISNSFFDLVSNTIDTNSYKSDSSLNEFDSKISSLIEHNQNALRFIGVSHESLEDVIEIAKKHGYSAKLTGGGGGGCALIHIPRNKKNNLDKVINDLESNGKVCYITKLGVEGLSLNFEPDSYQENFENWFNLAPLNELQEIASNVRSTL
ncbi:hypothetical protein BB559_006255 [Furculomyces boomerangus]|uniref:Mevalonate kinase n=1 Tax=Furculomyces boomerangus TaxID=61424 RepID=A0A2T9Y3X9_9FUNG|nr:hypothetical protein BB559_006255 [Furculomyces boomerangus]